MDEKIGTIAPVTEALARVAESHAQLDELHRVAVDQATGRLESERPAPTESE